jgi:DNA topoisomerase-1
VAKAKNTASGRASNGRAASQAAATTGSTRGLVIVESPTKARTLTGMLGDQYRVMASMGHVRDLPRKGIGVDTRSKPPTYEPAYEVPDDKKKVIDELRSAMKNADQVYLATDPDREGEAISWHLVKALGLDSARKPYSRVEFHEITRPAIEEAFRNPREINEQLVNAQQARRVLDRLVGYKVSPLLWSKLYRGSLSAGRVQSVALRMIVEREREVRDFVPQEYWSLHAELSQQAAGSTAFRAKLHGLLGQRGRLEIRSSAEVEALVDRLRDATYTVEDVKTRQTLRRPAPPFTTSTLQQEASRRLGLTARRTMQVAQQLYEGVNVRGEGQVGLITYMRTDSLNVAHSAQEEARRYAAGRFGHDFVPSKPRFYKTKSKGAQEAHEAIRPTSAFRSPEEMRGSLNREQARLYELIWQRFLASQMADATFDQTSVDIGARPVRQAEGERDGQAYLFRATASKLRFPGFLAIYGDIADEDDAEDDERTTLPDLAQGELLRLLGLDPKQHFTEPPPRFTEATLVKALEENGIGRPSTYATIISTIIDRKYIERADKRLVPTGLGEAVIDLLVGHLQEVFNVGFTSEMETDLDEVAAGEREWVAMVHDFYEPLKKQVRTAEETAEKVVEPAGVKCPDSGHELMIRWGSNGQFLACSGWPDCNFTSPLSEPVERTTTDEVCDVCGRPMTVKRSKRGEFLGCSGYPECTNTRPILKKTGVICPKCNKGDLVERVSTKGRRRVFYGCARFPECDYIAPGKPWPVPCPTCNGVIVQSGRDKLKCTTEGCGWTGKQEQAEERELVPA